MKKWRLLLMLCCVTALIAGCSKENKVDETKETESIVAVEVGSQMENASSVLADNTKTWETRIAVCLPEASCGWSHDTAAEAQLKLNSLGSSVDYILYTTTSATDQAKQISSLLDEDVDAVVLHPLDAYSSGESLARLQSAGISVVLFNGSVGGVTPDMQLVFNSETLGERAALVVAGDSSARAVLAFSNEKSTDAVIAYKAFEKNLSEDFKWLGGGDTGGDIESAKTMMLDWLKSQDSKTLKSVCAIFAPDEVSLRGIMEGLLEYEELPMTTFPNLTVVTGCGMDQELCKMIQEQSSYPIQVFGYSPDAIDQAVDGALNLASKKSAAEVVEVLVEEINKGNVNKYIK